MRGEGAAALPLLMGIVNLTPDSFSDGGLFLKPDAAIAHAKRLIDEGADWLDLGAESSRPGAAPLPEEQELARLLPVLRACAKLGVPVSVDTYKPGVMRAAIAEGAAMINDIWGFRQPGALDAVAHADVQLCVMHMQRDPQSMQEAPQYHDVVTEVCDFLAARITALQAAGVARGRIVIDPGFGFGKTVAHNLALLRNLTVLEALAVPVLVGLSRKSTIAKLLGHGPEKTASDRLHGSVAAALLAAQRGARILRVHDVAATRDALAIWRAVVAL